MHTDAEVARSFRAATTWVKEQAALVPIPPERTPDPIRAEVVKLADLG